MRDLQNFYYCHVLKSRNLTWCWVYNFISFCLNLSFKAMQYNRKKTRTIVKIFFIFHFLKCILSEITSPFNGLGWKFIYSKYISCYWFLTYVPHINETCLLCPIFEVKHFDLICFVLFPLIINNFLLFNYHLREKFNFFVLSVHPEFLIQVFSKKILLKSFLVSKQNFSEKKIDYMKRKLMYLS